STNCNSGETRSNIRFALSRTSSRVADWVVGLIYLRLTIYDSLVRSIVRKLHIDAKVFRFQSGDNLLQRIAVFARHAHGVALNRCLHLSLRIFDELDDVFSPLLRNALLNLDALANCATSRGFNRAVRQSLQRHAATHQFLLKNIVHVAKLGLVFSRENEIVLFQSNVGIAAFEVEALTHLFDSLMNRVRDFRAINLRYDVE